MARVRFLAPASDPREGKEGNVYGPLHESDFGDEDAEFVMTLWREGKVEILDATGLTPRAAEQRCRDQRSACHP